MANFSIQLTLPLEITIKTEIPPVGSIDATKEVFNNSVLYVPATAITAYEDSENWGKFKIILAAD